MAPERNARLARAEEALRVLAEYRERLPDLASYEADARARDVVERNIQIAVQAAIDLADDLIAARRWGRPPSAAAAARILVRHQILSPSQGNALRSWIRLRNVLVHEYAVIDNVQVHAALRRRLERLRSVLNCLAARI